MTSEIKADKWSPASGTAGTIGDSGDTFTLTAGANLTLGGASTTVTIPSGATIVNSGTATGFGEANNPSFTARMSAHQSLGDNVNTKVAFDTTDFATSGTYDTTNYKFTPGVAGNYQFMVQVVGDSQGSSELYAVQLRLYKNGSALSSQSDGVIFNFVSNYVRQAPVTLNVCDTADDDDYYEVYAAANDTSSTPQFFKYGSYFSAFKISGSA